jgi:hypothetical protein
MFVLDLYMRLSSFISENKEAILMAWEDFARTIEPPALTMDDKELRDHAAQMLDIIILDLDTPQTPVEQVEKSLGRGPKDSGDTYAEIHANVRLESGYTIAQLVSEYRALRASVLKLWAKAIKSDPATDAEDVMRFNEAIDQALAESVSRFADITAERIEIERVRLDAVLQAAPVGITLADSIGKLLLANPEMNRIWGDYELTIGSEDQAWKGWWQTVPINMANRSSRTNGPKYVRCKVRTPATLLKSSPSVRQASGARFSFMGLLFAMRSTESLARS